MDKPESFHEVLNVAIEDVLSRGFESVEQIDGWTRALRRAAERSLISPESLEQRLRDRLYDIYKKLVERGQLTKYHQFAGRFTIDRIRPKLRSELDRRIMASASLIKLNRDESIEKTLRRFQGWSTSIPKGGTSAESRREVKKDVKKALAQLPFVERRCIIDQGHKLIASINEIVAADGGAIAGRWRSHWRQPGYNYREDHKERDGQIYLMRGSWAQKAGYVKPGEAGYYDNVTAVGQEPFCRCYMTYEYALRGLPEDMLTAKGKLAKSDAASNHA